MLSIRQISRSIIELSIVLSVVVIRCYDVDIWLDNPNVTRGAIFKLGILASQALLVLIRNVNLISLSVHFSSCGQESKLNLLGEL